MLLVIREPPTLNGGKEVYMKNTMINIESVCDILTEMLNTGVTIEKGGDE